MFVYKRKSTYFLCLRPFEITTKSEKTKYLFQLQVIPFNES